MKRLRISVVFILILLTAGAQEALSGPPEGFTFIQEWGVYAREDDIFWHAGVEWKLRDGTWVRLDGGNWIPDPHPPAVIVTIPHDQIHCPPGLAKKGCVPPGQQKKWGPPGHGKKWK